LKLSRDVCMRLYQTLDGFKFYTTFFCGENTLVFTWLNYCDGGQIFK